MGLEPQFTSKARLSTLFLMQQALRDLNPNWSKSTQPKSLESFGLGKFPLAFFGKSFGVYSIQESCDGQRDEVAIYRIRK